MRVSILGCGWYGTALARALHAKKYIVNGSATTASKAIQLEELGIKGFEIRISSDTELDAGSAFWNTDVLIIASNVKLVADNSYVKGMQQVATMIRNNGIQKVVFISSTSVYGDTNGFVNEDSPSVAKSGSANALIQLEETILGATAPKTTILRFGGLVGPGRMPGRFFAGKSDIPNGRAPVNLIHLEDCIGITLRLLNMELVPVYLNAVSPDHPTRSTFYTAAAGKQHLPLPEFIDEQLDWKVVQSTRMELLGYDFIIKDWMTWIQNTPEE